MSETATSPGTRTDLRGELIERLRDAVALGDVEAITGRIQDDLAALIGGGLDLGERFRRPREDSYARRLFHRDPEGRFSVVVMTWGPGQATPLHDHAQIWCVEGVVEGTLEVARFELVEQDGDGVHRFAARGRTSAGVGSSGALIPPFEYHTLANASDERLAVTIHVYGGDMDHCSVFEPRPGGGHLRRRKELSFHD
jgi:predicted metal-dependent enzyme (double-stranded beta helix superfamily)